MLLAAPVDDPEDRLGADIPDRLCRLFAAANEQLGWAIPLDIVRYGVSCYQVGGFMAAHVDDEDRDPDPSGWVLPHRGISASVPLSDPAGYEGGGGCPPRRVSFRGWVGAMRCCSARRLCMRCCR